MQSEKQIRYENFTLAKNTTGAKATVYNPKAKRGQPETLTLYCMPGVHDGRINTHTLIDFEPLSRKARRVLNGKRRKV